MSRGNSNPLYSRGSLASGAVGVPNVADPSKYLYAAGQDMLQASETFFKAEAAKRKIAEDIAAEKYKIQWEHEYFTELEKQKQQSQEDPYGLVDRAYGIGEKSISSFANGISNPKVRDAFNKKAVTSLGSAQTMIRNWASNQTVDNAYSDTEQALATLYQQAGAMTTPEEFGMLRNQGESLINSAVPVIGIEGADKLRKEMGKQMAENFIYAKIDSNPWVIKKYVDSGMFNDIYDEKEQYTIRHTADLIAKRNEQEQKEAAAAKAGRDFQNLVDKVVKGELTLFEINNMIDDEKRVGGKGKGQRLANLQLLRETAIRTERYPNARVSSADALQAVRDSFSVVTRKTKKETKDGVTTKTGKDEYFIKGGVTFEQLHQIQDTLDSNAIYLTDKTRATQYQIMDQLWDDYLEGNKYHKKINNGSSYNVHEFNAGLNVITEYIDKRTPPQGRNYLKARVIDEYCNSYEKAIKQKDFSFNRLMRYWTDQIDKKASMISRYSNE